MKKPMLLCVAVLAALLSLSYTRPVYAYMDPGTTGSIFSMLAPFFAIFLGFLGLLIRPFRMFFISTFAKLRGKMRGESSASEEQQGLSDSHSDNEESGKSIGE